MTTFCYVSDFWKTNGVADADEWPNGLFSCGWGVSNARLGQAVRPYHPRISGAAGAEPAADTDAAGGSDRRERNAVILRTKWRVARVPQLRE